MFLIYVLGTCVSKSDDERFTEIVVVAISVAGTFIITLVVTALITCIVISLYYKHLIKKLVIKQEGDSHALTEDIKSDDPAEAYATTRVNLTMDTNPAYGTATTIKMDTNPAYATILLLPSYLTISLCVYCLYSTYIYF